MFGPPEDKKSECNARLFISDDYGDNAATMRCQLDPGHEGNHEEIFHRGEKQEHKIVISWPHDERYRCDKHGLRPDSWCGVCLDEEDAACKCLDDPKTCPVHADDDLV